MAISFASHNYKLFSPHLLELGRLFRTSNGLITTQLIKTSVANLTGSIRFTPSPNHCFVSLNVDISYM